MILDWISALGKLKVRKRNWYTFDEDDCVLLYYKSQEDVTRHKEPLGALDIRDAAITLSLNETNQFIIM